MIYVFMHKIIFLNLKYYDNYSLNSTKNYNSR